MLYYRKVLRTSYNIKPSANFTIIFSNSKGNKLKYDSSTDTIIELEPDPSDEDDPDETEPTNSHQSYNFLDYKYLFFLILLLI